MIEVPVPTVEKPLTAIDYIAVLEQCSTVAHIADYAQRCPEHVRNDERFTRAVARRLGELKERKRA
jgi:hypothetical protein